jgi:hypothetical protein
MRRVRVLRRPFDGHAQVGRSCRHAAVVGEQHAQLRSGALGCGEVDGAEGAQTCRVQVGGGVEQARRSPRWGPRSPRQLPAEFPNPAREDANDRQVGDAVEAGEVRSPPAACQSRESRCLEHGVITDAAPPAAELAFDGDQFECRAAVGLADDHVISSTPGAPWTGFTRSDCGHRVDGSAANASQAGTNFVTRTRRNVSRCSGLSRR